MCVPSLEYTYTCTHMFTHTHTHTHSQHVFIPVLPGSLIDFFCSPLPYIIGINPSCIKQIETMETMEEALIVDLEKKKFVRKVMNDFYLLIEDHQLNCTLLYVMYLCTHTHTHTYMHLNTDWR